MTARQVYFNEFNVLMGRTTYLPLVSGLLHASALVSDKVRERYAFMPYLFHIDSPETILSQYQDPRIAAFSVSMWNEQISLHIAREVKRRHPRCVVIFGGAQVPHEPTAYFAQHPFIDVTVRGEGEEAFREILERFAESRDLDGIAGVSWRTDDGSI